MPGPIAIEDLVLNYGPEFPQERFCSAGAVAVSKSSSGCLPAPIPCLLSTARQFGSDPAHCQADLCRMGTFTIAASAIVKVGR
jgi:hypothetical protein